ncbi:hypothetical protein GE21DRAFT_5505 [Neurospora crassa]|uniref:Fatty acid hydroxylase domain-containing protein n=1 Tax=Neurospora crassa (strain ATCC 24698 / 74-OR23-1A / CBS 708.71 / DSM 1257 / FGSC 987) TaxID=367110 RepID=Q7SA07_NEUCR|nr:hypothetical protein NCU07910 [Neurospora crassa OR74A]EAA33190.1 hypothetical protein NCU07910 [Neurospora crassa OR74A]KHE85867.1 hypothetical protein GE21DRAFT_5505 [Neurospora crassa]|eukprot:XP_962426.1 hypothetical protein NCU07910 [Neurospora crassa OR74A]
MASLLNLPFVSYFLPSSMTAWSTSLNLLFFYMTWTTLVLSQSPFKLEILGTLGIRLVFWLLPSLVFLLFDTLCPGISVSLKYKGAVDLQDRNVRTHARLLGLGFLNLLTSTAVQALISLGVSTLFGVPVFRTTTTLPLPWQMAKHIAILYLGRELLTYYIHRFVLHAHHDNSKRGSGSGLSSLANRLTNLHIRYAHAGNNNPPSSSMTTSWRSKPSTSLQPTQPTSLTLFTDHPIPSLLHRFLPLYLPPLMLSLSFHISPLLVPYLPISVIPSSTHHLHLLTMHLFTVLVTLEETLSLAGYTTLLTLVPIPGVLVGGIAKRQGRHFGTVEGMGVLGGIKQGRKSGNFGAWGLVDWVLGTRLLRDESSEDGAVVVEGAENRSGGGVRKGKSKAGEGGSGRQTRMSARRQREDLSKSMEEEIKQVAEGLREVGEGFVDGIKEFGEGMGVRRSGRIRERSSRAGSVMR